MLKRRSSNPTKERRPVWLTVTTALITASCAQTYQQPPASALWLGELAPLNGVNPCDRVGPSVVQPIEKLDQLKALSLPGQVALKLPDANTKTTPKHCVSNGPPQTSQRPQTKNQSEHKSVACNQPLLVGPVAPCSEPLGIVQLFDDDVPRPIGFARVKDRTIAWYSPFELTTQVFAGFTQEWAIQSRCGLVDTGRLVLSRPTQATALEAWHSTLSRLWFEAQWQQEIAANASKGGESGAWQICVDTQAEFESMSAPSQTLSVHVTGWVPATMTPLEAAGRALAAAFRTKLAECKTEPTERRP